MTKQRYALLSVSDKTNLETVAKTLVDRGFTLLSTGGTYDYLKQFKFPVTTIESYTGFPEMMDGRVKTLHPKVHGGLLSKIENDTHLKQMAEIGINAIDVLIVNLYPFKETLARKNVSLNEAIEQIDSGGPAMLRSAAKNFNRVSVVTDPKDYPAFIEQMEEKGETSLDYRFYLSSKVFELTSHYDTLIADYLNQQRTKRNEQEQEWPHLTKTYTEKTALRYGENSHQKANFYKETFATADTIAGAKQLHGKALSYNNIKDADTALKVVKEFSEPAAIAVKHMNPCGAAIGDTIEEAFNRCYQADSISIFGGIVALNRPVTKALAETLNGIFLEVIIAPAYEDAALNVLTQKKNLRLLTVDLSNRVRQTVESISVSGGLLVQDTDQSTELKIDSNQPMPREWEAMTDREPTSKEIKAMAFLMTIAKHVKSNAIVVGNDYMTLGIGAGQMNRVGAAEIALKQATHNKQTESDVFVMASDAFLPMDDTAKLAQNYGVTAIIQPGGSIRDKDSVTVCNAYNLAMVKTGIRHFRH